MIIHIVFSTKDRRAFLEKELRAAMHSYLATVARNTGCECYRVGGVEDHVHLAIRLSRTLTIADLVEQLRTSSSKWLKTQWPILKDLSWQRGYGCFSIAPKDSDALIDYIDCQPTHHQKQTFQDEFRMFLDRNGVKYDEADLWD